LSNRLRISATLSGETGLYFSLEDRRRPNELVLLADVAFGLVETEVLRMAASGIGLPRFSF
jgi:hypothetical protein